MAHEVENMFSTRETPWHGLGTVVEEALSSEDALVMGGLDWKVVQKQLMTNDFRKINGYKANVRETDQQLLGIVSDRYQVVQNKDAFSFVDSLLGEGVKFETAGSLKQGRSVWMLAKLPQTYQFGDDEISPYLVFSNTHDGSTAIKIAMTPIRVVCSNTLNLALNTSKRTWSTIHTGNMEEKLEEAHKTLFMAHQYMTKLEREMDKLMNIKLSDKEVFDYIDLLIPKKDYPTKLQMDNLSRLKDNLRACYFNAPDLINVPKSAYRFINAVSDFATHSQPLRLTSNYKDNLFARTIDGNPLIDRAYDIIRAIAS